MLCFTLSIPLFAISLSSSSSFTFFDWIFTISFFCRRYLKWPVLKLKTQTNAGPQQCSCRSHTCTTCMLLSRLACLNANGVGCCWFAYFLLPFQSLGSHKYYYTIKAFWNDSPSIARSMVTSLLSPQYLCPSSHKSNTLISTPRPSVSYRFIQESVNQIASSPSILTGSTVSVKVNTLSKWIAN